MHTPTCSSPRFPGKFGTKNIWVLNLMKILHTEICMFDQKLLTDMDFFICTRSEQEFQRNCEQNHDNFELCEKFLGEEEEPMLCIPLCAPRVNHEIFHLQY